MVPNHESGAPETNQPIIGLYLRSLFAEMKAFCIVFYQNFQNDQAPQVAIVSQRTPIRNFCAYLAQFVRQIRRFSQTLNVADYK